MDAEPPPPSSTPAPAPVRQTHDEQVRLLSEITHDIVWDWDLRGHRVFYNDTFHEILGPAPEEYHAGHAWWRTRAHPDDMERICRAYEEAMAEKLPRLSYEYRILNRADRYVTLDSRAVFIRDEHGELTRVLVASRDISKRRNAELAQERMTRILEATTDYVGMANAEGYPFYINAAGRKMLGLTPDEPLNFHFSNTHPEWANEIVLKDAIPTAISEGYWRGENAILQRDGTEIPVSQVMLSHRGPNGEIEFLSTIIRDLSDQKRQEIARIEWTNRYDAAIRASGQVLFDWNSSTNEITYAGDVGKLLGYSMSEMMGGLQRLRKIILPADLPHFDEQIQQVIVTRDPFHHQFRVQRKDGETILLESKGYFFLDRQGHIGRMVGFFADITAQKRAQEALARAHDGLEQRVIERTAELAKASALIEDRARQQEAVAQLGQQALSGGPLNALYEEAMKTVQRILRADCCSLLALTTDGRELVARAQVGWPNLETDNRVPTGQLSQSGFTLQTGQPVIVEDYALEKRFKATSAVLSAEITSALSIPVEGRGQPLGVLAAFTRKKRIFVQDDVHFLRSVANVLTAAIQRERAEDSVRQAREQAETASRAKSEFLSRMSHELRTPLNAILGFTQLLEIENPTPSQAESVQHISRAGKHLLSLINEVLDISRIESGRLALTLEPIDLHDFLRETIDLISPLAQRHEIDLLLEAGPATLPHRVEADRQRLQQVMLNLFSNAIKYNRPRGRVVVSYRDDGTRLRISVADTGRGIAPEKLARLFLPFERLGAEASDIEGTGIGLALSRGIVAALQSELNVESRVGEGSTFWMSLPRPIEDPAPAMPPAPTVAAPPPVPEPKPENKDLRTLLYIEDQDLNLRLVERIIHSRPNYKLLTAMQGGLGFDLAREHQPDLILLDLNLPDVSGDEVLRRLKADPLVRNIPVLMVSADAMGARVQQLLALGASGYLTKPYKLAEFLRVIEETLAKAEKKNSPS